jgi:hypothetical protein
VSAVTTSGRRRLLLLVASTMRCRVGPSAIHYLLDDLAAGRGIPHLHGAPVAG